jgi:hypothetical protein
MVECNDGAVRRCREEFGSEERERLAIKLTIILARDGGVEADDSQSTAPVHLIDRRIRRFGAEEVPTKFGAIVVVPREKDDIRAAIARAPPEDLR